MVWCLGFCMNESINISDYTSMSDEELVSLAKSGLNKAFDELVARFSKTVILLTKNYYVAALTREDWFQEGMIGLLLAVRTFNEEKKCTFATYASVCITNRLRSVCKKALGCKNEPLNNSLELDDTVVPPSVSTEDDYIENEEYTFFTEKYVSVLSAVEKNVVEYYIAGFSYSEIAKKLGMTEKSVDNALFRAKTKLKKAFS